MKPLSVARDLARRRGRQRTGLFVAEGVRCVEELMQSQLSLRSVIVSPALGQTARGADLESIVRTSAATRGFEVADVTDADLLEAAGTDTPQGIIAIAVQPERSFDQIPAAGLILLLDAIQDPGNVGTILRTAQAFGVAATIALPGTVDLWNPKVVRSAMGALFSQHAFHAEADDAIRHLQGGAIPLLATRAGAEPVERLRAGERVAIVVGNEAAGVSAELANAAARTVSIPISGVESLNVAVATGIILYALTTS